MTMENTMRRYSDAHMRISDPEMKEPMERFISRLLSDKSAAQAFLRSIGILPPIGPLEERDS